MRLCCCTVLVAWVLAMASRRKRGAELPAPSSDASSSQKEAKLQESDALTPSQKAALRHVSERSKVSSDASMATLHVRLTFLGLSGDEVKQRARQLLTFVAFEAPLIAYVPLDVVGLWAADPFLRNQFETLRSRGSLSPGTRTGWERAMFGSHYDGAAAVERVKYGCLNATAHPMGVPSASRYGDVYVTLAPALRSRVTVTLGDSGGCHHQSGALGTLEHFCHLLVQSSNIELQAMLRAIDGEDQHIPVSTVYKELQIHGLVDIRRHVTEIAFPSSERERMEPVATSFQAQFQMVPVRWF